MKNFHNLNVESSIKELNSSKKGLSDKDVKNRIKKYGLNEIKEEKTIGKINILLGQFKSPLIYILFIAGSISFLFKEYVDGGVILGAVFLNTVIGFFQENKANNALSKLKQMVEHKALVVREEKEIRIDSSMITVGDIIILQTGNRIPADARIIESIDLQINESSLTGESIPSDKITEKVKKGASLIDRKNMVYAGTIIVKGSGRAIVTEIGNQTEIGKIAELVKETGKEKTPLQIRLADFSKFLGIIIFFICLFVIAIGIYQGRNFLEIFTVAIALAVAAIPEGLIVAVTVILVLGMQQILKKKALTRKLVAAETLGSTTVICSDKTGTLTEGKMHVSHIVIGDNNNTSSLIKNKKEKKDEKNTQNVNLALKIGMMCNDAIIENYNDELDEWKIIGGPTEEALLSAAIQSGLNKEKTLENEPKIAELPFNSEEKIMITLHEKKDNTYILYEKGASENLLKKSTHFFSNEKISKITEKDFKKLNSIYENLTTKGLRVIGVAVREFDKNIIPLIPKSKEEWKKIDNNLLFVGFIALKDPLRPQAKETIRICKEAGIRPIIITGDHKLTAKAIALEAGLNIKAENIITGDILDMTDDAKLEKMVKKADIYARVSPHHKLRIVQALQKNGEVVAMTGDGINDSPALKAADIGISLGNGTDIAKETSDIVLLDNNFKTIVEAIKQGRIIFANIQKVITYLISDSFSEIILVIGSIFLGMPLAILPAQILWINIVNDGLPDFSLAFEKEGDEIMKEKPIKKNVSILNKEMKIIIFGIGIFRDILILLLFIWLFSMGKELDYLRTLFFAMLGFKSLFSIFSLRNLKKSIWHINLFSNKYLLGAVSVSLILLLSAIYIPFLQNILSTVSLDFNSWILIIGISVLSSMMIEAVKIYTVKKENKKSILNY